MDRVVVATLRRPRGNKGELVATSHSSHMDRFANLSRVFVGGHEMDIESTWISSAGVVFKFAGIDSISAAEPLAGLDVEIPRSERVELEPGEFYLGDLIGCEVFDRGELLGAVTGWQELPGQVLLEAGGVEIPYPMVRKVDLEGRRIDVELPEGLKELYR